MPKVSIIVPIYNVEKYLTKCLGSLVKQTLNDIEIICVNDGSTDESQVIVNEYVRQYPQLIKSFIKENGGLSDARNFGLKHATSDYIAFIDSDDYVHLSMIEKLYQSAINKNADISVCDMEYVYEDSSTKFSSGGQFSEWTMHQNPELLTINNSACNKLFKKTLFNDIEFIKGIWYEDLATIPKCLAIANKVVKVDEVLYYYLQRSTSIVHTRNFKVFDIYIAIHSVEEFLESIGLRKKLNEQIRNMYVVQALYLTNLRIKDYEEGYLEFYQRNHDLIKIHYPHWFLNTFIWNQGIKMWIGFLLFKLKMFSLLKRLYKTKQ